MSTAQLEVETISAFNNNNNDNNAQLYPEMDLKQANILATGLNKKTVKSC